MILARAIVDHPHLVVTEPLLNNMSLEDKNTMIDLLAGKDKPWTLVAVSRSIQFAGVCDRVIVLDKGIIIFDASLEALKKKPYCLNMFDDIEASDLL